MHVNIYRTPANVTVLSWYQSETKIHTMDMQVNFVLCQHNSRVYTRVLTGSTGYFSQAKQHIGIFYHQFLLEEGCSLADPQCIYNNVFRMRYFRRHIHRLMDLQTDTFIISHKTRLLQWSCDEVLIKVHQSQRLLHSSG